MKLSILDYSEIAEGETPEQALAHSVRLARLAEGWGTTGIGYQSITATMCWQALRRKFSQGLLLPAPTGSGPDPAASCCRCTARSRWQKASRCWPPLPGADRPRRWPLYRRPGGCIAGAAGRAQRLVPALSGSDCPAGRLCPPLRRAALAKAGSNGAAGLMAAGLQLRQR